MSKYGLPKGYRLMWRKGEKPTGLMRVTDVRASWSLNLRGDGLDVTVMWIARENATGRTGPWRARLRMNGQLQRLVKACEDEDELKEFADAWVVKNPRVWQQYLPSGEAK